MPIWLPIVSEFNDRGIDQASNDLQRLSKRSGSFSRTIGSGMKVAGLAIMGVGAAAGVAAVAGYGLAKAAAEDEAAAAALAGQLKRSTGATDAQVAGVERLIGKLSLATGVADDELRPAFAELVRGSNDIATAQRDLSLAMDISAATGKDVGSVSAALSKAYGGNLTALAKLDPQVRKIVAGGGDLDDVMAQLGGTFKGAAGEAAGTAEGKFRRLSVAFEEAKESIGARLLPIVTKVVDFLTARVLPIVERVMKAFDRRGLAGVWDLVSREAGEAFPRIVAFLEDAGRKMLAKIAELGRALVEWIGPRIGPALRALGQFIGKAANWIVDEGLPLLVDKAIQLGTALVEWIGPMIPVALKELGKLWVAIATWIVTEGYPKIAAQAIRLVDAVLGWIAELVPKALAGIGAFVAEVAPKLPGLFLSLVRTLATIGADLAGSLIDALVGGLKDLGSFAVDVGRSFANGVIGFVNSNVIDAINDLLSFTIDPPGPGPKLTINPPDLPHIPQLATGGIVTRRTLATIGEAGPEAVIPLDRLDAGSGPAVIVNISGALDPVAVATQIRTLLNEDARRRTGRIALA